MVDVINVVTSSDKDLVKNIKPRSVHRAKDDV